VELKARDPDPDRSLSICQAIEAEARGLLVQRDTYFHAPRGRMKLREEEGAAPHLIAYERSDLAGQRESRYRIVNVEQPDELVAALSSVLGVKVVIAKERQLFLWEGVRIHLDKVDGLGNFVEFEAVAPTGSDLSHEEKQVTPLRQAFGIGDADVIGGSYCDLALAKDAAVMSTLLPGN
jgi:predicted adenylyl cyclase CyaB